MTGDFEWAADVDLEPGTRIEFVFVADGSREKQWGDDNSPHGSLPVRGTATGLARTIAVDSPAGGPHRFTFNEETGEYSIAPLSADQIAPSAPVPPPQRVKEVRRAPHP
jgi:hypothetical protein